MREITKAMTSYTWAMSVFWTQQFFNLVGLGGQGSWNRSTRAFSNVTEATTDEMGETMRAVFRGGDTLQRGMVDLFLAPLGFLNGGGSGPRAAGGAAGPARNGGAGGWIDAATRMAQAGADVVQATVDTTTRATRRAADSTTGAAQQQRPSAPPSSDPSLGWGPMPRG